MKSEDQVPIPKSERSAFPYHWPDGNTVEGLFGFGLTKREYFAACAMQGLCAMPPETSGHALYAQTAEEAVLMADALITELERSKPK